MGQTEIRARMSVCLAESSVLKTKVSPELTAFSSKCAIDA